MKIKYFYNKDKETFDVANVESFGKTIIIPKEYEGKPVTGIGAWAFQDSISIEEVCLPDTIKNIGQNAFNSCNNLVTTFTYGHTFSLDNLMVRRGNANMLMSSITCFGGESIVNKILDDWYHDKIPLLLESSEIFDFESIHYLRVAIAKWASEKGLNANWIYCDKQYIDEDTVPYASPIDCDFVVLDSVDLEDDDEYIQYMRNVIYRSIIDEKPAIGLVRRTKENHDNAIELFHKHEIVFDERLEVLNKNIELKVALEVLSNSKRIDISTLQRDMGVGYLKAKKIFDTLVELKFIQQVDGKNIFKVIICT